MFWCKQDNPEEYRKIKESCIDYFIDKSIDSQTEHDVALVIHQMYKDNYVCVHYDKKNGWYIFRSHKWELDKGTSIRSKMSFEIHDLFEKRRDKYLEEYHQCNLKENAMDRVEYLKKRIQNVTKIMNDLKSTSNKNNFLRECAELFFDGQFIEKLDTNKNLLCFTNGVVDFTTKTFRAGCPQDYITKCTKIEYLPFY